MADESKSDYQRKFIDRTREAREASGHTQESIASLLGIPQDHYKWFETTRPLRHHLVPQFCSITRVNYAWLMAGIGPRPMKPTSGSDKARTPAPRPTH